MTLMCTYVHLCDLNTPLCGHTYQRTRTPIPTTTTTYIHSVWKNKQDWLDFEKMLLIRDAVEALAPMRAIWKASMITISQKDELERSGNILIADWIPQNDLLGHRKCLSFLTHCGRNSLEEAAYHGIPIVGMPRSQEQLMNLRLAKQHGFGVGPVDQFTFDAYTLIAAIETSMESDAGDAAIAMSRLIKAHPRLAVERAVDLIEFAWNLDDESMKTSAFTAPPRTVIMSNAEAMAPFILVALFLVGVAGALLVTTYLILQILRAMWCRMPHVQHSVRSSSAHAQKALRRLFKVDTTVILSSKQPTPRRRKLPTLVTSAESDTYPPTYPNHAALEAPERLVCSIYDDRTQ